MQRSERELDVIDATCPLVAKVHAEARRFAAAGFDIVLVGHEGHEEVEGTFGEAPDRTHVIAQRRGGATAVEVADPDRVAYLTQTTLAVDETERRRRRAARALPGARRPALERHLLRDAEPPGRGARAGRRLRRWCSSSAPRTHRTRGAWSRWPSAPAAAPRWSTTRAEIPPELLIGAARVGLTAGASAPEALVQERGPRARRARRRHGHRARGRPRRHPVQAARPKSDRTGVMRHARPVRQAVAHGRLPDRAEAASAARGSRCSSSSSRCSSATSPARAAARSSTPSTCCAGGCRSSRRSPRSRSAARRWSRSRAASR